jgi:hypothetical protein
MATEVFVYSVSADGEPSDAYVRVATVEDLSTLGTVRTGGVTLYRKDSVTIDYSDIDEAINTKSGIVTRIDLLVREYTDFTDSFVASENLSLPV